MPFSAFADKAHEPRPAELAAVLGRSAARWSELVAHLEADFAPVTREWVFSGAKWGWSLRLKRKKRAIVYLTPGEKFFRAGFALGEKAVAAVRNMGLPAETLELIDEADRYAEGRAVRLEVRTKADLEPVRIIAAAKLAN
ncbi:MAG: DUF3788 domain-containing protein [bacterium]|nr:DUF3788 domain-containing protein [bacterium]